MSQPSTPLHVGILGSNDFCRRISASIIGKHQGIRTFGGPLVEAWSLILSNRPNLIILEVGLQHHERLHLWLRQLLTQVRERFQSSISVVVALTASEKLMYGGDLLFAQDEDLAPSGFIDTFISLAPGSIPAIPTLAEQVHNVITLFSAEQSRREQGQKPVPALGSDGWVQSLADPKSRELWMRWLPRYASYTNESPIIIGETGTGKTQLAYALHLLSGRKGNFISITPRDFSSSELVQAELFGAVAGAYTGAVDKWGLVKSAEKGTLFIDELQSIDKDLQGKLITLIENKIYRRVGSAETINADVRFVFASNRTLHEMMASEVLRDDFAYRLERVQLELLPLRQRRLDISAALAYALAKIRRQRPQAQPIHGVASEAYRLLFANGWPGNLRQLENTVARLCELSDMEGSSVIQGSSVVATFSSKVVGVPTTAAEVLAQASATLAHQALLRDLKSLDAGHATFIELVRTTALEVSGGDVNRAAELLQDNSESLRLFTLAQQAQHDLEPRK